MAIHFPHLLAEGMIRGRPELKNTAFVLASPYRSRMRIMAASILAQTQGIHVGMAVADARAMVSGLQVINDEPDLGEKILTALGHWCIRYTPVVATDLPDGLMLDISGCSHLWSNEDLYASAIQKRMIEIGFTTCIAISGIVGAAWALARFGKRAVVIVATGEEKEAILPLPPVALRLENQVVDRLQKLGLYTIGHFIHIERSVLRRRFGVALLNRLDQVLGWQDEPLIPLLPPEPYRERLPCLEPIVTRGGIEIAVQRLIAVMCERLVKEGKGLRKAVLRIYRIDGVQQQIDIGTHLPAQQPTHLFKLFELKLDQIAPALGIELFILEAPHVEKASASQTVLWHNGCTNNNLAELLDRLSGKLGAGIIHRYLPAEHYWPERSYKESTSLHEQPASQWQHDRPRPVRLLRIPEPVEVTAPIPDYPPMHFRYKGILHTIKKADGPERIEREWWIEEGEHRDYYVVEDESGNRYWIFRLGHYTGKKPHQWYLHGFFA